MKVLNDFKCPSGHLEERYVEASTATVNCRQCGLPAERVFLTANFSLDPISGHFPSATRKWALDRENKAKKERKLSQ